MKAFLLMGQSNMAGRGYFGQVPPINNPRCKMLRNGRWQPMSEPINPDRPIFEGPVRSGVGLSASFADEFAKYYGEDVGLIPCADGGTKIEEWQPGEVLFDHAVFQAELAMRSSELAGVLWHQGESNSGSAEEVKAYRENFLNMYRALCERLRYPELPIILGGLGDYLTGDNAREITTIQQRLAEEFPQMMFVSARGLVSRGDGLHFDSASYREFGKRYFEAYRQLREKK